MSDYQSIFDSVLNDKPVSLNSDYSVLFDNVLKSVTNPVGAAGEYALRQVKEAFTPDTRTEGLQAGESERSPNYPVSTATDVTVPDAINASFASSLLGAGLRQLPKVEIDLRPKAVPERPALMDPMKANAIDTELVKTFDEAIKPETPVSYKQVFDENLKTETPTEVVPSEAKPPVPESQNPTAPYAIDLRKMWGEIARDQEGMSMDQVAPYVYPEVFQPASPRTAPAEETFYHGSGTSDITKIDPYSTNHQGLFGQGFYITDNKDIATEYSNLTRNRTSPSLYSLTLNSHNTLDMDSAIKPEFKALMENKIGEISQRIEGLSKGEKGSFNPWVEGLNTDIEKGKITTNADLFRYLRLMVKELSSDYELPSSEFVEDFQELVDNIKEAGYGSLKYEGGNRIGNYTGAPKHSVRVVLDPAIVRNLRNISASTEDSKILSQTGSVLLPGPDEVKAAKDFLLSGVNKVAEKLDTTGSYNVIDNLKASRRGYINEANFRDALVIDKALEGLSPDERKAMVFSEKWQVPKRYEADPAKASIVRLIKNPTPAMLKAREDIHPFFERAYQQAKTIDPELHHREDYIPNMYKQNPKSVEMKNTFSTTAGFTNERVLDNPAVGIDAGLDLKHEDAGDLFKAYSKTKNRAVHNIVFRNALRGIEDKDIIRPTKEAPVSWKHIPNAAFAGYSVNPEYYDKLKFLKGVPESSTVGKVYDTVSAAMKKSLFFGGGFHGVTMGESAVEASGLEAAGLPKALADSFRKGGASLVDPEWTARMLRANLNIVHPSDIEMAQIERLASKIDETLGTHLADAPGIKQIANAEKAFDKALWTHEQGTLKLYTARVLTEWADQNMPNTPQHMRDRHVAEIVNDLFGSQSWDLLFDNPQWQKWLSRIAMAPDYWISTLRTFVKGSYPGVQGHAARSFSARGWIGMLGLVAIANYFTSKAVLGKGVWPWSSEMEDERGVGHLLLWKFNSGRFKGRRLYVNFGKAFMEPYRLMQNTRKVLIGKTNPLASLIHDLITGVSLTKYDLQLERPGNTLKRIGQAFNPIQFSGSSLGGTFPLTMGFSYPRLEEGLKEAIWNEELARRAGDKSTQKKAIEQRQWVIKEARMNGLRYGFVEKEVRAKIQAQLRSEARYGTEGLQGAFIREATGFKIGQISDVAARELQSLRDRLRKNGK